MKSYFVYVLKSKRDKKFYTGFTSNLDHRVEEHNSGKVYSTKSRVPFELVYYEVCFCIDDATYREKYLKTTDGKRFIKNRIKNYLLKEKENISQGWIDFAASCQYITCDIQEELNSCYENIIGKLVNMSLHPENWSW
jgi:putative endonuclease